MYGYTRPMKLTLNTKCQDPAIEYACTKFGVDSSGHFSYRKQTHTRTQTKS